MTKTQNIIRIVYKNKYNGQKLVTIPKGSDIEVGDAVQIIKLEVKQNDKRTNE